MQERTTSTPDVECRGALCPVCDSHVPCMSYVMRLIMSTALSNTIYAVNLVYSSIK